MRIILLAAVAIAVLTGPVYAQLNLNLLGDDKRPLTEEEIEKNKAADRAYKSAIGKIPEKKTAVDPWQTVRPNPAAPQPKTGR